MRPKNTYLSQELALIVSNASKNGISEDKNISTLQYLTGSVKDINKCICKHKIPEALKFKNTLGYSFVSSSTMKHEQKKNYDIAQFLQFLDPETELASSSDETTEF